MEAAMKNIVQRECGKTLYPGKEFAKRIVLSVLIFALVACGAFAKENPKAASYVSHQTQDASAPVVYFTRDISAAGMLRVFQAMGWSAAGKTGVKISTGEPPALNYLRPALLKDTVQKVNGTIVECNIAYGGSRASNAMHKQVVKDHGFSDIAPFDLLDEDGTLLIPTTGAKRLIKGDYVGFRFKNYDSFLVISHFKGHAMAGFGGAIKNISIGFASGQSTKDSGKVYIHSGGTKTQGSIWGDQIPFLESMAEAAKSVVQYMNGGKNIAFINVLNRLSVDCDCDGNPHEPDMHDIGILASTDPLAIDQAAIDLVYAAKDSGSLIERIESRQGLHTLDYAAEIGLGKRTYRLTEIR